MPLGQTPFGSRPPTGPDEGPDPEGGPGSGSRRFPGVSRWLLMIGFIAMLAYMAALASRQGSRASDGRAGAAAGPSECITDRSCAEGWRCYAVPKDDPFVVTGVCVQLCEGDLQCPPHFRCEPVAAGDHQVVPVGARGAHGAPLGACRPCSDDGCQP
ncbi:MAG: hypothetical protein IPJ65_39950 [Archangiaceae bacterium]|nr:hypothetical protein [Archangiaceae bacterium]